MTTTCNKNTLELNLQRALVEHHFPKNTCYFNQDNQLVILGEISDPVYKRQYSYAIIGKSAKEFISMITNPVIPSSADFHIGAGGILCLFHKELYPTYKNFCFATEIIPLIIKWTLFYEYAKVNGNKFFGRQVPHEMRYRNTQVEVEIPVRSLTKIKVIYDDRYKQNVA